MTNNKECAFAGCERLVRSKGYCESHYNQLRKGIELKPIRGKKTNPPRLCSFEGCENMHEGHGLCKGHNSQRKKGKELTPIVTYTNTVCRADGCENETKTLGLCSRHYREIKTPVCPVEGCETLMQSKAKGYCGAHYNQIVLGTDPKGTLRFCEVEGCEAKHYAKGKCRVHYVKGRELPDNPCVEEDCEEPQVARGYCIKHYSKRKNSGEFTDIRPKAKNNMTLEELRQFIKGNTYTDEVTGCWIWNGKHRNDDTDQYHQLAYNGYPEWQHRVAYAVFNGELIPGLVIDHICHQKHCCNPDHLRQVTHFQNSDNRKDRIGSERLYYLEDSEEWSAFQLNSIELLYVGKFKTKQEARQAQLDIVDVTRKLAS